MTHTNASILELLVELQILDRVPRIGYNLRGVDRPESVSEHTFHIVFLAWALAHESPELDRLRVLELALVHDVPEVRMGDLPRTASSYFPPGAKSSAELAAAKDILAPLGPAGAGLVQEYQQGSSPEARFVSCCDKLQLLLKVAVYERWGAGGLEEFHHAFDTFDDGGFEAIARVVEELRAWMTGPRGPSPTAS